jgi:hypothetical protein
VFALVIVLTVTVALLAVLVCGLLRSHAEILRALHGLGADLDPAAARTGPAQPGGAPLPWPAATPRTTPGVTGSTRAAAHDLVGVDRDGNPLAVGVCGAGHRTLLAFLSTGCTTCHGLWSELRFGVALDPGTRLVVVVRDLAEESPAALRRLAPDDVPVIAATAAWRSYEVPGSPHFVLVDGPAGTVVGEGAAGSWRQVLDLLGQAGADTGLYRDGDPEHNRDSERDHSERDNAARIDAELAAQGIGSGHPSLYPSRPPGRTG